MLSNGSFVQGNEISHVVCYGHCYLQLFINKGTNQVNYYLYSQ